MVRMRISPTASQRSPSMRAFFSADGVKIGQDLGGVLTPAVTAVDDRNRCPFGGFVRRTLLEVAHHDHITVKLQHLYGVFNALLVPVAGTGHFCIRKSGHMAAQAVHGGFVSQPGAGDGLVEGGHHGLLCEKITVAAGFGDGRHFIRNFEHVEKLLAFEFFERQNITT